MSCYPSPYAQARADMEQTLTARCDRYRAVRGRDATGAPTYTYTLYLSDRPCSVVAPALTPDVRGQAKLIANVDFTFKFQTTEPAVSRTERFKIEDRWFEVTSVGLVQDSSLFLKVLAKEVV